ncbi:hypothetical protein CAPI_08640 [Corynebacterium capitovis DSM 44611]|nr:hypothetical protein CAPI_08640 [Corynebacterium capitovis DSM 44611]
MDEFDQRCSRIAAAQFHSDLAEVFADLPQNPTGVGAVPAPSTGNVAVYTAPEIAAARRSGQHIRAGVFWLGSIGAVGATSLLTAVSGSGAPALLLLLIPTLFILLYVMKVGPNSWYAPSLRQLERHRRQLVKAKQLEIEAANAQQAALLRVQRQHQLEQLKSDALDVAQQTMSRFRKR